MKTIEIKTNGGIAEFSTKSLKIGDTEYSYAKISDIKHSSAKRLYLFQYEGHWHKLEYAEGEADKTKALFGKIAALKAQREAAAAARTAKIAAALEADPNEVSTPEPKQEETSKLDELIAAVEAPADTASEEAIPAPVAEPSERVIDIMAELSETQTAAEPEVPEAAQAGAEAFAAEEEVLAAEEAEEERKGKLKKSLLIFAAIIAVFAIAAVAYFFVIGPSSNPNIGPNSDGTQQYNDIDELIEDLQ
ncbi:MAG: hypothetical protein PUB09_05775 [Firmicutes bacterium]|nr:hypothetical protein [Bacillota bacterium]